ncbi:hypothetical protein OC610_00870 [Pseudomonas sp. SAICEU22]|uniref:Uncharacterized protein n=1 Tax=Pseudomonas agronomica TaxID=2979328 RepID=A0ABT3F1I5_9PSED|nr:hypothetical protein [Pseudomonas agronomica]MCW1242946.1 hypothetical protein [Pseudomonas agronomica]
MNSIVKAVIIASVVQIVALCFVIGFVYHRSTYEAAYFAVLAQSHAEAHADDVALRFYNQLQKERSAERDDLHIFIDKRIGLKIHQAFKQQEKEDEYNLQ